MMGQVRSGRGGQGHPPHRPTECEPLSTSRQSRRSRLGKPGLPGSHDETEGHEPDHGAADDVQHGRRVAPRESETGLLSGRLVAVVAVCSGRECIDCVPHSLLLLPAPLCHQSSTPPPLAAATATITRTTSAWRQSCCASDQTRFYFHGHHIKK